MKKIIAIFAFCFFIIFSISSEDFINSNINDVVSAFILENRLPIAINEEILFTDDVSINDITLFEVFILNQLENIIKSISEGNFTEQLLANLDEILIMYQSLLDYYVNNNVKMPIIIMNFNNENNILIEYLEYNNYNLSFHNTFVVMDNNTDCIKLDNFLYILKQINGVMMSNILNYFSHDWENGEILTYRHIFFVDGQLTIIDNQLLDRWFIYNYFDYNSEIDLLNNNHELTVRILRMLKLRSHISEEVFDRILQETIENNNEINRLRKTKGL